MILSRQRGWFAGLALLLNLAGCTGCAPAQHQPIEPAAAIVRTDAVAASHLHVLMINGGGGREQNYQSHLLHIQQLLEMMRAAGIADERISIFNADGDNPDGDVAVREGSPEKGFWLLEGSRIEPWLRGQVTYSNSVVPGMPVQSASKDAIRGWFEAAAKVLTAGDTVLLYVTDHGTRNPTDLNDNHIILWGKDAKLSVKELRDMMELLPPQVRVVTLMSQCYSGAFANLLDVHAKDSQPTGNVCGYFSSTADRPAYGCYPENRGRRNVGHSFHFFQGLAQTHNFSEAHTRTLVSDASPDVPLRTSDEYLERLLRQAAGDKPGAVDALVDQLLQVAWATKASWEPDVRLLDRIGKAYGIFSPRTLSEIAEQTKQLPLIADQMKNTSRAWRGALHDSNSANFERFVATFPDWAVRSTPAVLKDLDATSLATTTTDLIARMQQFTDTDPVTKNKLHILRRKGRSAAAISYRMEVRLGVVLRMRKVLTSIAGRVYIATKATPEQRAAYASLVHCEDLTLPGTTLPGPELVATKPFPEFKEDVVRAQESLPAWLGIQFRDPKPEVVTENKLPPGAAAIVAVYPESPAATAGLQVGDVVLGTPDKPFTERGEVRSWTMMSKIGDAKKLAVLRDTHGMTLTITPKEFPLKWPELPGPPKVGSAAPPLSMDPYRGDPPKTLVGTGDHLLFFWATWCGPCKASLPEVVAFAKQRKVQVVAITDEAKDRLDEFFKIFTPEFPNTVVMDDYRKTSQTYGVSGTPTFVLIDNAGVVRAYTTGYNPEKGLGIEGWTWKK